jgi:uncharacterized protein YgbK (DUF1537 family)
MARITIIADDLTGGADSGAGFAQAGLVTLIVLADATAAESDVLVFSTESRHLAADQAAAAVQLAARRIPDHAAWIYKKIDSTLRGHPALELGALMDTLGLEQALVAPAFPAQGRTTVDGQQRVDGRPLEHTPFGHQVGCSDLRALFGEGTGGRELRLVELSVVRGGPAPVCESLSLPGPALVVADAQTEADLATLAQAALSCQVRLLCGSAGLARALADVLRLSPGVPPPRLPPRPVGPALVVAGSRHPSTARQVEVAQRAGADLLRPEPGALAENRLATQRTLEKAAHDLALGRDLILSTAGLAESPLGDHGVADWLADAACRLVTDRQVGRLILTGGDIAAATCAALEASALWCQGETQPGIAWGLLLGGLLPGLAVVTKAGGFGADDALAMAISRRLAD